MMEYTLSESLNWLRICRPSTVSAEFSFKNMIGVTVDQKMTIRTLYNDWYGDCRFCPSNDTVLNSVAFYSPNGQKFLVSDKVIVFGDLMDDIERVWNLRK